MKDRTALNMIEQAEREGRLKPGGTIIESSSGNTGIGLAMIAASKGYKFVAVVDRHSSQEKIAVLRAYGAQLVFVDGGSEEQAAIQERRETAAELSRQICNSIYADQANNPRNPESYETLARELAEAIGEIRFLIGAVSTGGSLCGTSRALKQRYKDMRVIMVEPEGSTSYQKQGGPYLQSGTGMPPGTAIPKNYDYDLIDEHLYVSDKEAFNSARFFAKRFGILMGGSGGGVVLRALEKIQGSGPDDGGGKAVAIVPDGGEKYVSTIFSNEWMTAKRLLDTSIEIRLKHLTNLHRSIL